MRRVLFVMVVMASFITTSYAQIPDNSVRKIVRDYLVVNMRNGEYHKDDGAASMTSKKARIITFNLYNSTDKKSVNDYLVEIPNFDKVVYYRFWELLPHARVYLMFAKKGKYMILDMRESLCNIDTQFEQLCDLLKLNKAERIYALAEILRTYSSNYKEIANSTLS